jgi:tetratricopeptide (TPR) repeat protein
MSATADPLYTLFVLCGLWIAAPDFTLQKIFLSLPFYTLGLLSKETAIVFPAMMIACIFLMKPGRWRWQTYLQTWPLWIVALAYLIARKTIWNFNDTFQFYKTANIYTEHFSYRVFTFLATLPSYVQLLFWPRDLQMDHEFPVFTGFALPVVIGTGLLLAGVWSVWHERKSMRPLWSFAFLWFLAAHVPHMGVLLPVNAFFLEHWLYLPVIGFFLVGAQTLFDLNLARKILAALSVAVAVLFAVLTWNQNQVWATPISLYTHILQFSPNIARIHNNLAMALSDQHQERRAMEHYMKAIELSDVYPQSHHNLGLLMIRDMQIDDAIKQFERALEMNPDFYQSAFVLSQIYHQKGDMQKADEYSRRAIEAQRKVMPTF